MRLFLLLAGTTCSLALDNGVGRTPPMGWNSWNHFHCSVSSDLLKATADDFVALGLTAEFNSVFLHLRKLLKMLGRGRTPLFLANWALFFASFVATRILLHGWLFYATIARRHTIHPLVFW